MNGFPPGAPASLHRLELTVVSHNQAGIGLYQKMGFQIEGTRREALRVNGAWVDECYMVKVLAAGVVPQSGWTAPNLTQVRW